MIADILRAFFSLFIIIDMLGNSPLIFKLLKSIDKEDRAKNINKVVLVGGIILFLFLIFGDHILTFFGISLKSFILTGGIILFIVGIEMVLGIKLGQNVTHSFGVVPIATPFLIGPGVLVTIMVLVGNYGMLITSIAAILNLIVIWLIMKFSQNIVEFLGDQGSETITKVMGLILTAISIELIIKGLAI